MTTARLAVRIPADNPDHHLWNNNGTWWLHCTIHLPDFTSHRIRRSLGTRDVSKARTRRDRVFASFGKEVAA